MTDEAFPDALPPGYRLHWYTIERVLGQGGFGITHLARDTNLDRLVAIKEYLPANFGHRRSDAVVRPRTEASAERFAWGLERFIEEARTLARFDHPNIVRVASVFEANNTAYMVMRFEDGEDLATLLDRWGTLPEQQLLAWLLPILEGLQLVHDAGFIHRDIKPENIYLRRDGSPVLLDFGSARQSFGVGKTMTVVVAPGYAALEQYYGDAATQGPWTDIYGLGATCYRAITGRAPIDAVARAKGVLGSARELLPPAVEAGRGRYDERLLAAVDHAMQLGEVDRPQSVAEWRREILGPRGDLAAAAGPGEPAVRSSSLLPALGKPLPDARHDVPAETSVRDVLHQQRARLLWGLGAAATVTAVVYVVAPTRGHAPGPAATTGSMPAAMPPSATLVAKPPPVQEVVQQKAPLVGDSTTTASQVAATVEAPVGKSVPRETRSPPRSPAALPVPVPPRATVATSANLPIGASTVVASASLPVPAAPAAVLGERAAPSDASASQHPREALIDAAEAALRSGDLVAAEATLAPLAAAGVPRAQALLGRVKETGRGKQKNVFEAYIWYSMAARNGEPGAIALRDRISGLLQPAEIRQADELIERWKPRVEPSMGVTN